MFKKIGVVATVCFALDFLALVGIIMLNQRGIWGVELMIKAGSLFLVMVALTLVAIIAMAIHKKRLTK